MWKEKVTNVSEHFFPGISCYNDIYIDKRYAYGSQVFSNLPLQITLYFNVVYLPYWLCITFVMLPLKFNQLGVLYQIILILALVAVIIIELVRLYMGYFGNLKEEVPELAGFWLVSLLLQMPLHFFLLFCRPLTPSHIEIISQSIICVFLTLELFFGFFALRYAARHSASVFHFKHLRQKDRH